MLQAKEPKMALEDLASVLKDEPNNFVAICTEAHCMFLVGNFEKSLMVWHKELNRNDETSALIQFSLNMEFNSPSWSDTPASAQDSLTACKLWLGCRCEGLLEILHVESKRTSVECGSRYFLTRPKANNIRPNAEVTENIDMINQTIISSIGEHPFSFNDTDEIIEVGPVDTDQWSMLTPIWCFVLQAMLQKHGSMQNYMESIKDDKEVLTDPNKSNFLSQTSSSV